MNDGPRGGRRHIENSLYLVPFIDLFATIIVFLVITAVFDQLAAVQINMGVEDKPANSVPKDPIKKVESNVKITIQEKQIILFDEGKSVKVEKEGDEYNVETLETFIDEMRQKYPVKKDMLIFSEDNAQYKDLITVMDLCLGYRFTELIVTGNQG